MSDDYNPLVRRSNPNDPTNNRVSPVNRFRNQTDDGRFVESTRPMGTERSGGVRYYYLSVPTASMFRPDGMRLAFVHKIHCTDLMASQNYLDAEIEWGHPHLREATSEEIREYSMFIDPRGTMKKELEPEIRESLEAKIRAELEAKYQLVPRLGSEGDIVEPTVTPPVPGVQGVDVTSSKLQDLKERMRRSSGAVITDTGPISQSTAAPLGGIQSTVDIKDNSGS